MGSLGPFGQAAEPQGGKMHMKRTPVDTLTMKFTQRLRTAAQLVKTAIQHIVSADPISEGTKGTIILLQGTKDETLSSASLTTVAFIINKDGKLEFTADAIKISLDGGIFPEITVARQESLDDTKSKFIRFDAVSDGKTLTTSQELSLFSWRDLLPETGDTSAFQKNGIVF